MFKLPDLLIAMGRPVTDDIVCDFFNGMGIELEKEVNLESGLFTAHLERKNDGISFTFTDEAMFLGRDNQSIGEGALYFSGVFFYAEGKDEYSAYTGELPEGLSFSFGRSAILRLLGEPSHKRFRDDKSILGDRWDKKNYSVSVTYSKDTGSPVLVSLFVRY